MFRGCRVKPLDGVETKFKIFMTDDEHVIISLEQDYKCTDLLVCLLLWVATSPELIKSVARLHVQTIKKIGTANGTMIRLGLVKYVSQK